MKAEGREEILGNIPEEKTSELLAEELDWWGELPLGWGSKVPPRKDVPSLVLTQDSPEEP